MREDKGAAEVSRRGDGGNHFFVPTWLLMLSIPATLVLLSALLFLSAEAERRFLSPRSLILGAVRARRTTPEYAEAFVVKQFERLLRDAQR